MYKDLFISILCLALSEEYMSSSFSSFIWESFNGLDPDLFVNDVKEVRDDILLWPSNELETVWPPLGFFFRVTMDALDDECPNIGF